MAIPPSARTAVDGDGSAHGQATHGSLLFFGTPCKNVRPLAVRGGDQGTGFTTLRWTSASPAKGQVKETHSYAAGIGRESNFQGWLLANRQSSRERCRLKRSSSLALLSLVHRQAVRLGLPNARGTLSTPHAGTRSALSGGRLARLSAVNCTSLSPSLSTVRVRTHPTGRV